MHILDEQQWIQRFEELKAFHKKHGHSDVPKGYEENPTLGLWVDAQRKCFKMCLEDEVDSMITTSKSIPNDATNDSDQGLIPLTKGRIDKLNTLNFKFPVINDNNMTLNTKYEQRWNEHFEELKIFHGTHGHSNVPYRCKENPSLGIWCKTQRRNYKKFWKLNQLENSNNDDGKTCITSSVSIENNISGSKKTKFSSMTQERIVKLQSLNFVFPDPMQQMTYEERWNQWFEELKIYYEENKHSNVPVNYEKNTQLGTWVYRQRKNYITFMELKEFENIDNNSIGQDETSKSNSSTSNGKKKQTCPLTLEMIGKLQTVDFVFPCIHDHEITSTKQIMTNEQKWNKRFEDLKTYFEENRHSNVPGHYKSNSALSSWVYNQRTLLLKLEKLEKSDNSSATFRQDDTTYTLNNPTISTADRKKKLQERIVKLRTVDFKFADQMVGVTNEEKWNRRFEELKAFHKKHGHSDVPTRYKDNTKLGWWVNNQRKYFKTVCSSSNSKEKPCPLTQERIKKLHTVGFKFSVLDTSTKT
jgi:hypothetical protein